MGRCVFGKGQFTMDILGDKRGLIIKGEFNGWLKFRVRFSSTLNSTIYLIMSESEGLTIIGYFVREQMKNKLDSKQEKYPLFTAKERVETLFLITCGDTFTDNVWRHTCW
jgi:hypothetical protein